MAKLSRNDPCPCGSGRKAKRCCGTPRGPSERSLARAELSHRADAAASMLASLGRREAVDLFYELAHLPAVDLTLVMRLPTPLSPELDRLIDALADDDPDAAKRVLPGVIAKLDTPELRLRLARALAALAEAGKISDELAAAGLIDLCAESQALVRASLLEAAALAAGVVRTPGGLRLAA